MSSTSVAEPHFGFCRAFLPSHLHLHHLQLHRIPHKNRLSTKQIKSKEPSAAMDAVKDAVGLGAKSQSGQEPVSGKQGAGTAGAPFDQGNEGALDFTVFTTHLPFTISSYYCYSQPRPRRQSCATDQRFSDSKRRDEVGEGGRRR